ncbi:hypothetical protein ACS0TY_030550 [Phlomoides rotata]
MPCQTWRSGLSRARQGWEMLDSAPNTPTYRRHSVVNFTLLQFCHRSEPLALILCSSASWQDLKGIDHLKYDNCNNGGSRSTLWQ